MNQRKLLSTLTFSVLSFATFDVFSQDSFQGEASIFTTFNDDRYGAEVENLSGGFRWYAKSINSDLGPWSELAFLSKSSFYDFNYSRSEQSFFGGWSSDSQRFSFSGRQFVMDDTFIDFGYRENHYEYQSGRGELFRSFENSNYHIGIGSYLTDTSSIVFNVSDDDVSDQTYSVAYENIVSSPKGDFSHGYNASLAYNDTYDNWVGVLGYSFYPSRDWKINADLQFTYDEDLSASWNDTVYLNTGVEYFFNPKQSIHFNTYFVLNTPDDFVEASEVIGVRYQHRF